MTKLIVAFCNYVKALKTTQLMLHREIIAVCSEIHTKQINMLCGQNVEFPNAKPGSTCTDHCAVHIVTAVRYI